MISLLGSNLLHLPSLLAQATDMTESQPQQMNPIVGMIMGLVWLVVIVALIASMWKVFTKAGQPGWAAIVPIYNAVVLLKIAGRPVWWIVLLLIPFVNFIIVIIVMVDLAKAFGKGAGFGIGLALLGFIFFPILAFGDARYQGAAPTLPGATL